ncbi:MAG: CBS domain-containing protein, partial [Myxococcota bacterium]
QSEALVMEQFRVEDVMRAGGRIVPPSMPLPELVTEFLASRVNERYVVDTNGRYHGVISLQDINELTHLDAPDTLIIAEDIARLDVPTVSPRAPLTRCMERMLAQHSPILPVVDNSKFLGTVSEHDIIGLYNREVIRKDILGTVDFERPEDPDRHNVVHLPHGFVVEKIPIPPHHAGKSLKELHLRAVFDLTVVSVHDPDTPDRDDVPNPERPLPLGVYLVVVGRRRCIDKFLRPPEPADDPPLELDP